MKVIVFVCFQLLSVLLYAIVFCSVAYVHINMVGMVVVVVCVCLCVHVCLICTVLCVSNTISTVYMFKCKDMGVLHTSYACVCSCI